MRLRVKRNLNIRKLPDSISTRRGVVLAGTELDVEGSLTGEDINGNAVWYYDKSNNYYWSGGLEPFAPSDPRTTPLVPSLAEPHIFVDYSDWIIRDNPGLKNKLIDDPIRVAVLDSGIYEGHPDLLTAFDQLNFPTANCTPSQNAKDHRGHGTHVAGLIGARSDDRVGVVGTAPKCIMRNIKVIDDAGVVTGDSLLAGLNKLSRNNVDVVNISLDVPFRQYKLVADKLKEISEYAIILAAAGNDPMVITSSSILYPAASPHVISVGAVSEAFFLANPDPNFNKRVDFMLPALSLTSCAPKEKMFYQEHLGSSMATAIVSGMVARILQTGGVRSTDSLRLILKEIATRYHKHLDIHSLTLIKPS